MQAGRDGVGPVADPAQGADSGSTRSEDAHLAGDQPDPDQAARSRHNRGPHFVVPPDGPPIQVRKDDPEPVYPYIQAMHHQQEARRLRELAEGPDFYVPPDGPPRHSEREAVQARRAAAARQENPTAERPRGQGPRYRWAKRTFPRP